MRYFVALAEELNFTRAAERLGIAQPPLSQQIKALETELGTPLFRRLPHGAELTIAGLAFLEEARALTRQAERAQRTVARIANGRSGRLRIGLTGSAAVHPVVVRAFRTFRAQYGDVELAISQHDTDTLFGQLRDGSLDCAFVRPGSGTKPSATLVRFPDEPTMVALPATHARARARRIHLATLREETLLLFPRRAGSAFYDEIIAACHRVDFDPQRTLEVPQITAMPSFVAAGLGIALVPRSLSVIALPEVAYVAIAGDAPVATLALAAESDSPVTRNFVAIAAQKESCQAVRSKNDSGVEPVDCP